MAQHLQNPAWWTNRHTSAWDRVRDAMRRDWEQTKHDLHMGGRELHQDVSDTMKQAAGKEPIPPRGMADMPSPSRRSWNDVEGPLGYGYGARLTYGQKYPMWSEELETNLERDWHATEHGRMHPWQKVKAMVRRGYEYVAGKS